MSLGRLLAYSRREAQEIVRDPVRLVFAFLGSALMMLVFGFGITTDVENIRFAYLDHDQSPVSRAYLSSLRGLALLRPPSPSPDPGRAATSAEIARDRVALEVEPNFGRNLGKGDVGEITAWRVDGAPTNRAESFASTWSACTAFPCEEVPAKQPRGLPQPGRGRRSRPASSTTRRSRASTRSSPACRPCC